MKSRHQAREATLQALYQCDALNDWSEGCLATYFNHFLESELNLDDEATVGSLNYVRLVTQGVLNNKKAIDIQISEAATHWSISRIQLIDRNILRLACFEIMFVPDIPINVSINEAIELAKDFGGKDSPTFVNGVLDKVASKYRIAEKKTA